MAEMNPPRNPDNAGHKERQGFSPLLLCFRPQTRKCEGSLTATRFKWLIPHFLNPCLQPPLEGVSVKAIKANEIDCDLWLGLWLSCASVEVDSEKWSNALRLLDARLEGTADERWARRVNLSIMYQVLQIEPMAYLTQTN